MEHRRILSTQAGGWQLGSRRLPAGDGRLVVDDGGSPVQVVRRVVVVVVLSLRLRAVVATVYPVALRPLLVVYHLLQVWVRRVHLLLEVDGFAPDVGRRVFVDFTPIIVQLLLRVATLHRDVSSDATVSSSLLFPCLPDNFLVTQLSLAKAKARVDLVITWSGASKFMVVLLLDICVWNL